MNFTNIPTTAKYPCRITFLTDPETREIIKREAILTKSSMSEIIRNITNEYYSE